MGPQLLSQIESTQYLVLLLIDGVLPLKLLLKKRENNINPTTTIVAAVGENIIQKGIEIGKFNRSEKGHISSTKSFMRSPVQEHRIH